MDKRYGTCEEERQSERGTRSIDNNNTLFVPEELLIQILLRLPVKSIIRFKCVCKSWFSLISDPHFATSHFELAASCTQRLVSLAVSGSECISRDLNASLLDDSDSVKLNFLPIQPHCYLRIRIMGSCRGFLLLDCNTYLNIWNPSTGVKKRISLPPLISTTNYVCSYGFGYDPSTDDYLVVVVVLVPFDVRINVATSLELFSLRADTWTKIEGTRLPYMYPRIGRPVYKGLLLNGAIHWLCVHRRTTMLVIFAFDLMERSVYEIPLPDDFVGSFLSCDLRVLGGFLSLSVVVRNSKANIWVMKEYKVKSSWTKSIDGIPNVYFSPICSTKSGDIVGKDGGRLMKYNDKGQLQEHRLCCVFPRQYDEAMYTESLLSLPRRQ